MRKNSSSGIRHCFFHKQELAVFAGYFENRNFEHIHIISLDKSTKKFTYSPIYSESIIIVSSNIQIELGTVEDAQREYVIDILLLDTTTVHFWVHQKSEKITYRFFLSNSAHLYFDMAVTDVSQGMIKIVCHLLGSESCAELKTAFLLDASKKITLYTEQHHRAVDTKSELFLRGFVTGSAQFLHQGIITINEEAQHTQASQQSKMLLGSISAQAKSIPSLEIKAHDVRCQHGSALGYLDEQQLFYLQSRGFDIRTAQKMLLEAFFAEFNNSLYKDLKDIITYIS